MRHWFEMIFDRRTVIEFLAECRQFTEEFIVNYAKEMIPSWPLTNILPNKHFIFEPNGAVIHTSESPSLWNALHMCTRHIYGTHFMVLSGRNQTITHHLKRYPLLSALPTPVLLLYPLDAHIPHSGYFSSKTWSIELRNAGRLRPYRKGLQPQPLMPSEETENNFNIIPGHAYDAYWRQNLWCLPFSGNIFQYNDRIYEMPTYHQLISLVILLRILDTYCDGMDMRAVVPSNCVNGADPKFPYFRWNLIRDIAKQRGPISHVREWTIYPTTNTAYEYHKLEMEDESLLGELMEIMRWRGERDDGQVSVLYGNREFFLARGYRPVFETMGYNNADPNFTMRMWTLSHGLQECKDNEIYGKINKFVAPSLLTNVHPIR